jgi:hypothetical protein
MVQISGINGYMASSDIVDAILTIWWKEDFNYRRILYQRNIDKFSLTGEYLKFSNFLLWLDARSVPITDELITTYITSNKEDRAVLIASKQNAVINQQNAIKRRQIMP